MYGRGCIKQSNMDRVYKFMVATRCFTYNQADYITETLEGFAMQKTTFPCVFIIVDDASKDGEQEVLHDWAENNLVIERGNETAHVKLPYGERYVAFLKDKPNSLFVVLLLYENHFRKKSKYPYISEWQVNAKYRAICEGDDYWTEPHKLQIQIDYLESHPEIPYSCTRFKTLIQKTGEISLAPNFFFDQPVNQEKDVWIFSREDAFNKGWTTKTLTSVYRSGFDMGSLHKFKYARDVHLFYLLLSKGNGVCHSFVGGVYRKNEDSTYGGKTRIEQYRQNYLVYEELYEKTHDPIFRGMTVVCYLPLFKGRVPNYKWPKNSLQLYAILIYWPKTILFEFKNKIKQLFIHHKVNE